MNIKKIIAFSLIFLPLIEIVLFIELGPILGSLGTIIEIFFTIIVGSYIIKQNAIYTSYNPLDNNNMNRKIMIIIPDNSSNGTRPGYPRQANRNISYPPMNDDDLGEEIGDITKNNNSITNQ